MNKRTQIELDTKADDVTAFCRMFTEVNELVAKEGYTIRFSQVKHGHLCITLDKYEGEN